MENEIKKEEQTSTEEQNSTKNSKRFLKNEHYMNSLNVETKNSMKNRILIGAMLVLIVVPCLVLGEYVFAALVAFTSLIACHEIINTPQSLEKRFHWVLYVFAYIMMASLIFWVIIRNNLESWKANPNDFTFNLSLGFKGPRISLAGFFICVSFFFFDALVDKKFKMNDAFYFIGMLLIISVGFQSILFLRYAPESYAFLGGEETLSIIDTNGFKYGQSMLLVFYMLMGTCLNDVGAYFIGVTFGKHKMCPNVSPKKTWEGFIGGVVVSLASTLTFALSLDASGIPLMAGVLDLEHWYNVLILSLIMPIFGVFGDLLFSQIKRTYNIKDFGKALKSHGGILDRLDSIFIVSIVMSLLIEVMAHNWSILS